MSLTRRALLTLVTALVLAVHAHARAGEPAQASIILATTTSTQDSGLLDVLVPRFEKERGITVKADRGSCHEVL